MPTRTKNQIRPRRDKWHFTNAEILLLDTVGFVQLLTAAPLGQALSVQWVQVRTNIVQAYGNIGGVNPYIEVQDDFNYGIEFEDLAGNPNLVFTQLFTFTGVNLASAPGNLLTVDSASLVTPFGPFNWTDLPTLAANGGLLFTFTNGGADLNGGDVGNYMDIFIDYIIVDL